MKYLIFIPAALLFLASCVSKGVSGADLDYAASAGREAALEAVGQPSGSMAQEDAILAIRARETELRRRGLDECADTFAAAAAKVFADSLGFR